MKDDFYKSVMKEAPIGYACHRIIFEKSGTPYDYEYVDVNSSFEKLIGLRAEELIGRRFTEIFPRINELKLDYVQVFGDIAIHGGEKEIELYSDLRGRWYRIKVFSPEKNYFITFIQDTSKENEQTDELKNLAEVCEKTEFKYKSIAEEKDVWQKRLHEIANVLKLENDQQFQRIIENLPFSLNIINLDGVILYANSKCLELYEIDKSAIGTKTALQHWVDGAKQEAWIETLEKNGVINDFEMHLKTLNGKEFWSIGSGILIQYQSQSCVLTTQLDITERKRMESALKISEEKYRLLTEYSSDVIWVLNLARNRYIYVSPSIYYLTGYTPEEALEMTPDDILTQESLILVREKIKHDLTEFIPNPDNQKSYITEIRQKCKNGEVIWVEISSKFRFNEAGEIEIVGASRNVEERKRAEREVLYLSYHDQLTGLFNRRFHDEELKRMNIQRNMPLTLIVADVNGLKLTNDAFGHFAGDELLQRFSSILNKELRSEDVAARIGGDEFTVLLPKMDSVGAEKIVSKIKASIGNERTDHSRLSVSFGWATKETVSDDFDTLFMQAEDHMYHRKLLESARMKNETIHLAIRKLFERNSSEQQHSERVGKLCKEIGQAMELPKSALQELELLGRLHDIGKIGVPEEILNKRGKLNETEWLEIKRHPEIGYQILRSADQYVAIAESVLSHHERMDGTGYPRNLKSLEIPLPARILSIAEAYDSMIHSELYNSSTDQVNVIKELMANSGTQFDGEIVKTFIEKVLN